MHGRSKRGGCGEAAGRLQEGCAAAARGTAPARVTALARIGNDEKPGRSAPFPLASMRRSVTSGGARGGACRNPVSTRRNRRKHEPVRAKTEEILHGPHEELEGHRGEALRQAGGRPLHQGPHHPHERHRGGGGPVRPQLPPPLRGQRPAPRDRSLPPHGTDAAEARQLAVPQQRDDARADHRLRATGRRPDGMAGHARARRVFEGLHGLRPARGLRPSVPLRQPAEDRRGHPCPQAHARHHRVHAGPSDHRPPPPPLRRRAHASQRQDGRHPHHAGRHDPDGGRAADHELLHEPGQHGARRRRPRPVPGDRHGGGRARHPLRRPARPHAHVAGEPAAPRVPGVLPVLFVLRDGSGPLRQEDLGRALRAGGAAPAHGR